MERLGIWPANKNFKSVCLPSLQVAGGQLPRSDPRIGSGVKCASRCCVAGSWDLRRMLSTTPAPAA
eukprot:11085166-Prorocentrum_lima.AAC.1